MRTKQEYIEFAQSNTSFLINEIEKLEKVKSRINELERVNSINSEIWTYNRIIDGYKNDIKELNGEQASRPWGKSLKDRNEIKDWL